MRRIQTRLIPAIKNSSLLRQSARLFVSYPSPSIQLPRPVFDTDFYTDPRNRDLVHKNIVMRKGQGDIDKVLRLSQEMASAGGRTSASSHSHLEAALEAELFRLPNMTHPAVRDLKEPCVTFERPFTPPSHSLRSFEEIARILGGARLQNLGLLSGERSYYLTGPLAELEHALVNWAVDKLIQEAGGKTLEPAPCCF